VNECAYEIHAATVTQHLAGITQRFSFCLNYTVAHLQYRTCSDTVAGRKI